MPFKTNITGIKAPKISPALDSDRLITEIFIFLLAATFAYMGYKGGIASLLFLSLAVVFISLIAIILSTYSWLKNNDKGGNQ